MGVTVNMNNNTKLKYIFILRLSKTIKSLQNCISKSFSFSFSTKQI